MKLKDARKEALIMRSALKLVEKTGLAGLTMAAIARASRLGMGTLYVYFKSKEELINALYRKLKDEHGKRILPVGDEKLAYPLWLKKVWINYVQDRIQYSEEHFFIDQCAHSHFLDKASRKVSAQTYEAFHQLLNEGKSLHLLKDIDNEWLTAHLTGSANELARLVLDGSHKLDKRLIDTGFALAWDSIKK